MSQENLLMTGLEPKIFAFGSDRSAKFILRYFEFALALYVAVGADFYSYFETQSQKNETKNSTNVSKACKSFCPNICTATSTPAHVQAKLKTAQKTFFKCFTLKGKLSFESRL